MGTQKEIFLPDIGDFSDVEIIEIIAAEGQPVEQEDSLITLETDKASMEIPSPVAGTVIKMSVSVGDIVNVGDLICVMDVESDEADEIVEAEDIAETAPEPEATVAPAPPAVIPAPDRAIGEPEIKMPPAVAPVKTAASGHAHASPAIRRFARELGVNLAQVGASGRKNRVTKEDVKQFVKQQLAGGSAPAAASGGFSLPQQPDIDFSKFGEVDIQPLGRIKKISGAHLHKSWLMIPHITQFDEADITELEAFRKEQKDIAAKQDIRLTFMPFLMKACARSLQDMPDFNSSLAADGENLIYKKYVNIGIAVDTPNGLMVPVIKDVDKKSVFDLAKELMEISGKARDGKLGAGDMQGGCFTISSLGGIGGTQFTPIVNSPEVAILGVSRSAMKPVWNGKDFEPRMILPLALSYDHRVIDGAQGVRFTTRLSALLTDIRGLLL